MNISNDKRKEKLFNIIKNLYTLIEQDNFKEYFKLKEVFNNLLKDVFGANLKHGSEAWDWDDARNGLDDVFTFKTVFNGDKYKEIKKEQLVKALRRIEKLKDYL
jgi:hypothetical protein